jgi:hypothetical protein
MKDNKAPLFGTWTGWYILVAAVLVMLILFFYWLTKRFA